MGYWQISVPTVTASGTQGVQIFTYDVYRFASLPLAERQVGIDMHSASAIRHRRGAMARPGGSEAAWHDPGLQS
ncbi:hypothetical protein OG905_38775 [Streptomyces sp. NBC_00322]|uniref:hypothetical protein n=1 Tax=Streptomyces sp. NBC_00322 TaxID=2975712 RepID=UPI002E2C3892|nr:hypothetical protein [Streptomyces sp. NBC_00322]